MISLFADALKEEKSAEAGVPKNPKLNTVEKDGKNQKKRGNFVRSSK